MRCNFSPDRLLLLALLVATVSGCGGSGGGGSPTAPPPPAPPPPASPNVASFVVSGGGQNEMLSYNSSGNTVFCTRNAGWASLWIRMARDTAANGDNGPRIDLDLCNHAGGGAFGPQDPRAASCAGAKTFDIFWHAADGSVFSNRPAAAGCALQLTQSGTRLTGTFACRDLAEEGGTRSVDILSGTIDCTES